MESSKLDIWLSISRLVNVSWVWLLNITLYCIEKDNKILVHDQIRTL